MAISHQDRDKELDDRTANERLRHDKIRGDSFFVPILLLTLTLVLLSCFQLTQLSNENEILQASKLSQETTYNDAKKVRLQLNSIATQTAKLAKMGNPNAQVVMDALNKRGITVNPDGVESN
ncbi:MAG: hypothetical protein PHG14_14525 [Desulfobacter postgatei]|uniref:hypothetical protein n=1 Tax=Desulfobacter postgatei TaxID=2293 RepID=UPI0023F23B51|nr:hypothetical protein [Desulfobacter postgatei]MDD4274928.1 hypothetical protein [Desulfobacter postgatei]